MRALLGRLDAALHRAERLAAAALFLLMALVMFASVVQRIYSRQDGRVAALVTRMTGVTLSDRAALALNVVLVLLVVYAAVATTRRDTPLPRARVALVALAVTAALVGLVALVLVAFPNGIVWGPAISLTCMLWVGFLGASLATYEKRHLALEMGEKIWPARVAPYVRALAMLATAGLCLFLLALSFLSIGDHHAGWMRNPLTGTLGPTAIPKWIVFLIFPYTFAVMSLRFLGQALDRGKK